MKRNLKQKVWLIIRLYNLVKGYLSVIEKYIFGHQKLKQKNSVKTNDTHSCKTKFLYYRHTGSNTKKRKMITRRGKKQWFNSPLPQSRLWRVIHKFLIVGFVCIHNCAHNPITNRCLSSDRSFYFCWNWIDIEKKRGKNTQQWNSNWGKNRNC